MGRRSSITVLVVSLLLLSPVAEPILQVAGPGPQASGREAAEGAGFHPMAEHGINFSVRNPSDHARGPEVAWVEVGVPPGVMASKGRLTLLDRDTGREVRAGVLDSDVVWRTDGSVERVRFHFKDWWDAGETNDYRVVLGRDPQATGPVISTTISGEFAIVRDGARQYQVHTEDSVLHAQNQGVYYLYLLNGEMRGYGSALTRVGGNQLDPDQASFQMWWGSHTDRRVESSGMVNRLFLKYTRPEIVHWGPAGATIPEVAREVDFLSAELELTFYQGIPRIDVRSRKTVNERFWNHNGFVMEFSAIVGDGADWKGDFEVVFGTDQHIVMTTTNQAPTWQHSVQWMDIDVGSDAAPALADLDGDGDLDMLVGSEPGNLTAWENHGNQWLPDMFRNTAWENGLPSLTSPTPALADLDGDGDADMVVGDQGGKMKVYRNEGGPSGPPSWSRWWGHFDRLGLGYHTAPCVGDPDGDGDADILVGLWDGTLRGFINTGNATEPSWRGDDAWVDHLIRGYTRAPTDAYSVPHMADMDGDGDLDLLLGSDDGKVTHFENTGNPWQPRWDRLELSNYADMRTGSAFESNSTPVAADIDGDGDLDVLVGTHRGTLELYTQGDHDGVYRGHNNLQPLLNGTYRHVRDKDGNDGPFVVEGYGHEWYGYYVLANPQNGYAAMRYIPDFDRLAYKQEYWGDEFKFAGGNVSYYPYDPVAREYVTRAQITSNAMSDGVSGGTFISQTGTSAGFVMQPMTAMTYDSEEVLLMDLQRRSDPTDYDEVAEDLRVPLQVLVPVDLVVSELRVSPQCPGDGEPADLLVTVENLGNRTVNATTVVEANVGDGHNAHKVPVDTRSVRLTGGGNASWTLRLDNWGWRDRVVIQATIDPNGVVAEANEFNNNATIVFRPERHSLPWSDPLPVAASRNSSLDADAVVMADGRLYVVWETCQGYEEIDIEGRTYNATSDSWGPIDALVTGSHYAVEPDLVREGNGMWVIYASNIEELRDYHRTANARYYWGEKFDIWGRRYDRGSWLQPVRITDAEDHHDSDQAPEAVAGAGGIWTFQRNTHFQFYTNGNQMDNIPFQEMDVMGTFKPAGGSWSDQNNTFGASAGGGSDAWWGGITATQVGNQYVYMFFEYEVSNTQWDLFIGRMDGASYEGGPFFLQTVHDEVRPALASGARDPELLLVFETDRNGNRDIAASWKSPTTSMWTGWSSTWMVTSSVADDMKPTAAYDGKGNYWVAWESDRGGNKDIFISRFDGNDWHGPYQVTDDPGSDEDPVLACEVRTGRVYLVWETDRNGMGNKDIYMRHMLPSPPKIVLGNALEGFEDTPLQVSGSVEDANDDLHHVEWDWGDGEVSWSRGPEANHTYTMSGDYTVSARPFDRYGLIGEEVTVGVSIANVPPVADLVGPDEVVEDEVFNISAWASNDTPSDVDGLNVEWDLGDGTTLGPSPLSQAANLTHSFDRSGTYRVTVNVTDDDGDSSLASLNVTVLNLPPVVEAWALFEFLDEDEEGDFAGSGSDTPSDETRGLWYKWDWGDGSSTSWGQDVLGTHSYPGSGTYTVTLRVMDDDGEEGTATIEVVVDNVAPEVEAFGPSVVTEDEEVMVMVSATDTPHDLEAMEYRYEWGDGTVSGWTNSTMATHTYIEEGSYYVTVTARDDDGVEATFEVPIAVDNVPPTAKASVSEGLVPEGALLHFSAEGSSDTPSDEASLTYRWDLGTGFKDAFEFDHAYYSPGMYAVELRVTDDDGESDRDSVDVMVVNRPPVAVGFIDKLELTVGEVVNLDGANSTDDPWDVEGLRIVWYMGDGTTYRTRQVTHVYMLPGSYRVVLEVTDGDGDEGVWNATVTVTEGSGGGDGTGGGGGDGGDGLSTTTIAVLAVLVVVAFLVAVLLVTRSRRGGASPGTPEEEEDERIPDVVPDDGDVAEPPQPEEGPVEEQGELLEEEVVVLRPREGEAGPDELVQRIQDDLELDGD